jgi:glycosyltransferase involved in cell wall biosynthesis
MAEPHDRPLRICLLSYRSNPHCGGQGVYLKNLSRALADLGHEVEVVSGPPDPLLDVDIPVQRLACLDLYNPDDLFRVPSLKELAQPINLMEWLGVSTMGFPEPFTFGLRAFLYLHRRLERFDVIHDNQSLSYGLWALSRRIPTVATIHHPITVDRDIAVRAAPMFWDRMRMLRWYSLIGMQKRVARRLPGILTVSTAARRDISRDFAIPESRFAVVPNGIDLSLFRPLPGIPREAGRIIVTNSADTPLKGLHFLLQAVAALAPRKSLRLVVIGSPKADGPLVSLIEHLGIGRLVTFTGRVSDAELVRQYARACLAVVPSVYEGFGLPAGEAMACGVPVISTTGGALPEVVGEAGILVPPSSARALAQAIAGLLEQPQRARALGAAGLHRVRRQFSWKRAAEKTAAFYREVIGDHGPF